MGGYSWRDGLRRQRRSLRVLSKFQFFYFGVVLELFQNEWSFGRGGRVGCMIGLCMILLSVRMGVRSGSWRG